MKETSERGLFLVGTVAVLVNAHEADALNEAELYDEVTRALGEYFREKRGR